MKPYSRSPALQVTLRNSLLLRLLHAGLLCCTALACVLILQRGYWGLALSAAAWSTLMLWQLRPRDYHGCSLCWRQGQWLWQCGSRSELLALSRRRICLPWCLYLDWRLPATGKRGGLWLLPDSASPADLAHLRRRLRLQH